MLYLRAHMRIDHIHKTVFPFLLCCVIVGITILSASAKSHNDEAKVILDKATAVMDIRSPGSKPFQMVAGFHLFGDKSNNEPSKDGMYTEIWNSPEHWRTEFDLPGFQQIEVGSKDRRWLTQDLYLEKSQTYLAR
jgi:hypothetical protein